MGKGSTATDAMELVGIAAEPNAAAPRGIPKSGRVWKTVQTKRHSAMFLKNKVNTWEAQKLRKQTLLAIRAQQNQIIEAVRAEKMELRRRRLQKQKQKEENERKSEVVQTITDTRKIKKMNRKQLKMIRKR